MGFIVMLRICGTFSLGVTLLAAGCTRIPTYMPPDVPPSKEATLAGVSLGHQSIFKAVPESYVTEVDGIGVGSSYGYGKPSKPVPLTPGQHDISIGVAAGQAWGFADFTLDAGAGEAYTIQITPLLKVATFCAKSTAWLADESGKAVTEKIPVFLQGQPPAIGLGEALLENAVNNALGWNCPKGSSATSPHT